MDTQEGAGRSAKYEHGPNFTSDMHLARATKCSSIMEISYFDEVKTTKANYGSSLRNSHSILVVADLTSCSILTHIDLLG